MKINWLNHIVEFTVVIVGILVAFELDSLASDRKDSETIQMHLMQINEETKFNHYVIKSTIEYGEINEGKIDTLLDLLSNNKKSELETINRLSFELLSLGAVYFRVNAYTSLQESGDIQLIDDFEMKNRIIRLYEYYRWVDSFEAISLDNYNSVFYPYMIDNMDLINGNIQDESVYFSKKYKNSIATYGYTLKNKIAKYHDCLEEIEKFMAEQGIEIDS